MYTISKEFHFSAAHHLLGLRKGHPCGRQHGHNYIIVVELQSETLNEHGFVQDYGELTPFKDFIDNTLDHKDLNDLPPFDENLGGTNPTAENIAKLIYDIFKPNFSTLHRIGVSETPKTMAWHKEQNENQKEE